MSTKKQLVIFFRLVYDITRLNPKLNFRGVISKINLDSIVDDLQKASREDLNQKLLHLNNKKPLEIQELIDRGANVNVTDNWGETPLHLACSNFNVNSLETIKLLLKNGANPNVQNRRGNTPLHFASCLIYNSKSLEVIELLLNHGAEFVQNKSGNTPLHIACLTNKQRIKNYKIDIVKLLLNKGIDITIKNSIDKTAKEFLDNDEKDIKKLFAAL